VTTVWPGDSAFGCDATGVSATLTVMPPWAIAAAPSVTFAPTTIVPVRSSITTLAATSGSTSIGSSAAMSAGAPPFQDGPTPTEIVAGAGASAGAPPPGPSRGAARRGAGGGNGGVAGGGAGGGGA